MRSKIKTEELDNLKSFGKEDDRTYSDRYRFSIIKVGKKWNLYSFEEIGGDIEYIKTLKDIDDLKETYFYITNKELI